MAETVAEPRVAVGTEVAVDVLLALGHEVVNASGVLCPLQVKVLPEGGSSHVEHSTPVLADDVHSLLVASVHCQCLQHVVSVEGGEALGATYCHVVAAGLVGFHHACNGHQSRCLLESVGVHSLLAQSGLHVAALLCVCFIAQQGAHLGGILHGPHQQCMVACIHTFAVGAAGPVEEVCAHGIVAVLVYALVYLVDESQDVVAMLLEELLVAESHVPVMLYDEVPQRVGTHAVYPCGQRVLLAREVHTGVETLVVTEYVAYGSGLRVHVTQPHQAVALHSVPDVFLHVEVYGVGACHPDVV